MTLDDFTRHYNGRFVDYDGMYGYQCVDLMRAYCKMVLGIPGYTLPPVRYAHQLFSRFPDAGSDFFAKIYRTCDNRPHRGDIVIWNPYPVVIGWTGHVAICDQANDNVLVTFDQNYPTHSPCHFVRHDYRGVVGWLSPIVEKGRGK